MTHHPIRDLPIRIYHGENDSIAFIGDGRRHSFPYFRASTGQEAEEKAEAFRQRVIADHEAAYIARQETAAKARTKAAERRAAKSGEAA